MDCNTNKYKYVDRCKNNDGFVYDKNYNLDVDDFTNNVVSQIFDKAGSVIDRTRNILIFENKKRYYDGKELICTKNKCAIF